MGCASGPDRNMQALEMSATALQQFIMKITGNPAWFDEIAGMEVKEFSALIKTGMNGALTAVLKSLRGRGGLQQLIPVFKEMGLDGARASQVDTKNDNLQARLEKAKKRIQRSGAGSWRTVKPGFTRINRRHNLPCQSFTGNH
jgi:hypothetical protein